MKQLNIYPSYYDKFRCIAADCEDSCCAQWQIVVDDETAFMYENVDGEIGEKLRSVQETDEDGDRVFRLDGDRCPFWERSGLCEIHRCLGEEYLCGTCSEYPRAVQDYGDFAEHDLSLSCPEAARIILSESLYGEAYECCEDIPDEEICYEPELMSLLKGSRQRIRELIIKPELSVSHILYECYTYAERVQCCIDGEDYICPELQLSRMDSIPRISYVKFIDSFLAQEILTDEWREMLLEARALGEADIYSSEYDGLRVCMADFDRGYRRMLLHYIDRYWLRAAFDGDVMDKIRHMAAAYIMLRRMQTAYYAKNKELPLSASQRLVQLYSKEIEHNSSVDLDF